VRNKLVSLLINYFKLVIELVHFLIYFMREYEINLKEVSMQFFGKYDTRFDSEFLVESYFYFNEEDKEIEPAEFEKLIKNKKLKKKNVAGTIFMYSPFYYPEGFDEKKKLSQQDFEFDGEFQKLKIEREMTLFKQKIKGYEGKIIQVRFLFNLNIRNIDTDEILMTLNDDVEKLNSEQLTRFDKDMNYSDVNNLDVNGKFVLFAWGSKINEKEFVYLHDYAKDVYEKCVQMQKNVVYVYKRSTQKAYAVDNLQFQHPIATGRFKDRMPDAFAQVFSQNPPICAPFNDLA